MEQFEVKKKSSLLNEYFKFHIKYEKKYGPKTIIFIYEGSFYEAYSTDEIGVNLHKISEILNYTVTKTNNSKPLSNDNPYMLGFPIVSLQKNLGKLIKNDYSVVIIDQITPAPNPKRAVTGIY